MMCFKTWGKFGSLCMRFDRSRFCRFFHFLCVCVFRSRLNGSSTVGSPDPKPLVDRVAELEEKLVNCSMENATAKQVC